MTSEARPGEEPHPLEPVAEITSSTAPALRIRDALAVEAMVMGEGVPIHASVALQRLRAARPAPGATDDNGPSPAQAAAPKGPPPAATATRAPLTDVGLALSGGGIRSATFGLP